MITNPVRPSPTGRGVLHMAYPVLAKVFQARGWDRLREQPAVLVYQMAKVGSQAVVRSLRASRPGRPVFHVHTLTDEGIAAMEGFYRWSRVPPLPGAGHLLVSRYLKRQIQSGVTPGRWRVVTLVRDLAQGADLHGLHEFGEDVTALQRGLAQAHQRRVALGPVPRLEIAHLVYLRPLLLLG